MSVQCNHYFMVGCKFDYRDFFNRLKKSKPEWFDEDDEIVMSFYDTYLDSAFSGISHHNGICVLLDGMGEEYVYVGNVYQKSYDFGILSDYVSNDRLSIDDVCSKISKEFGFDDFKCDFYAFSHYR